jgi:hypothetical protein
MNLASFCIVQPWGLNVANQSTLVSEHVTIAEAFRELERLAEQMVAPAPAATR